MKKIILIFGATALLLVTARATSIVFDTFGSGDTYATTRGYDVGDLGGLAGPFTYEEAAQFTAGASGNLATVYLGLTYLTGFAALPVNVYLYSDASGSPNNANQTLLGSATPTAVFGTTNNSVVTFSVAGTVPVTMGSTYWLILKPAAPNEFDIWNESFPQISGMTDQSIDDSTWANISPFLPAFRLTASSVSSVPDSGSTLLLMLGAFVPLLFSQRKFTRQQVGQ
jgi:hypothetical protein